MASSFRRREFVLVERVFSDVQYYWHTGKETRHELLKGDSQVLLQARTRRASTLTAPSDLLSSECDLFADRKKATDSLRIKLPRGSSSKAGLTLKQSIFAKGKLAGYKQGTAKNPGQSSLASTYASRCASKNTSRSASRCVYRNISRCASRLDSKRPSRRGSVTSLQVEYTPPPPTEKIMYEIASKYEFVYVAPTPSPAAEQTPADIERDLIAEQQSLREAFKGAPRWEKVHGVLFCTADSLPPSASLWSRAPPPPPVGGPCRVAARRKPKRQLKQPSRLDMHGRRIVSTLALPPEQSTSARSAAQSSAGKSSPRSTATLSPVGKHGPETKKRPGSQSKSTSPQKPSKEARKRTVRPTGPLRRNGSPKRPAKVAVGRRRPPQPPIHPLGNPTLAVHAAQPETTHAAVKPSAAKLPPVGKRKWASMLPRPSKETRKRTGRLKGPFRKSASSKAAVDQRRTPLPSISRRSSPVRPGPPERAKNGPVSRHGKGKAVYMSDDAERVINVNNNAHSQSVRPARTHGFDLQPGPPMMPRDGQTALNGAPQPSGPRQSAGQLKLSANKQAPGKRYEPLPPIPPSSIPDRWGTAIKGGK